MHDLNTLVLPKLVAVRTSSQTSLSMSSDALSAAPSSTDSGFFSASSDCSTPPTPSLQSRGHFRFPSAASSLSSSPPTHDAIKLPKLTEEPVERELDAGSSEGAYQCFCDIDYAGHAPECIVSKAYDPENEYFTTHDAELRLAKRRRSLEASAHSLAGKLERRFPSFSRKVVRDRNSNLGRVSRSATPSRVPSTRSSSITSSVHHASAVDLNDNAPLAPIPAVASEEESNDKSSSSMSMVIDVDKANAFEIDPEEVEAERYATTPLLPPLLVNARSDQLPASSPLQSPTIADTTHSMAATPCATPPTMRAYPTPPLSSRPSIISLTSRAGYIVSSPEIPPMMLADPNDRWANKLGHANFTILPEPYIPEVCDASSVTQLMDDWKQARNNYSKHQVRTAEHYGATSKYYLLTEQKWAEIDAEWRLNHELAKTHAAAIGQEMEPTSPAELEPLSKMPALNNPNSTGKFPKLGDEDIVGPMVQHQTLQKPASRKRAFFKFLSDFRFPALLGRSSVDLRSH